MDSTTRLVPSLLLTVKDALLVLAEAMVILAPTGMVVIASPAERTMVLLARVKANVVFRVMVLVLSAGS